MHALLQRNRALTLLTRALAVVLASLACLAFAQGDAMSPNATVFATGLDNPRGLALGHDGMLYVAEGGTGGTTTTAGQCEQVPEPVGPYLGGGTARISRIDKAELGRPWSTACRRRRRPRPSGAWSRA